MDVCRQNIRFTLPHSDLAVVVRIECLRVGYNNLISHLQTRLMSLQYIPSLYALAAVPLGTIVELGAYVRR